MNKQFHIGAILSVTTGRLVAPNGVSDLYEILNYMTGDDIYTHQLPRAMSECAPWLLRQHPALTSVGASAVNEMNWQQWLAVQVERFGETLSVEPIPADDHSRRDPVKEAQDMVGPENVVVVDPDDEG